MNIESKEKLLEIYKDLSKDIDNSERMYDMLLEEDDDAYTACGGNLEAETRREERIMYQLKSEKLMLLKMLKKVGYSKKDINSYMLDNDNKQNKSLR